MRSLTVVMCLGVMAMLAGCIPPMDTAPGSLYPIYASDKNVATDPALLGEWRDNSDTSQTVKWFFREDDEPRAYLMGIVSGDDFSTWRMRLVKSEGLVFLDVLPLDSSANESAGISGFRISLHVVLLLQKQGDRLRLSYLDADWYLRQLELKQFPLKVDRLGDNVPVITSPPEELLAFYKKAAIDPDAFTEIATLQRYQSAPAASSPSP